MNKVKHNRLIDEKSPYLIKHATNPVNWYPWGEEAFESARAGDRPVFLSVGYHTCHWCNVMEEESFSDPEVAALLNENFVSIKVDREERPDIDNLYMTVCQMMTGGGGWPLTVIMTPDRKPFFAGTYYPKHSAHGRVGLMELVPRVMDYWRNRRDEVMHSVERIAEKLGEVSEVPVGGGLRDDIIDEAARIMAGNFDPANGGFSEAPKFPMPHFVMFLLRHWSQTGQPHSLQMAERTLEGMRLGGMFDHLGGGFHRYSTDQYWLVPHFEKMLYDQALLAIAYLESYQAVGRKPCAAAARDIFRFVLRDMVSPEGAFYSAWSADSEGEEGRFYLWTEARIRDALSGTDPKVVEAMLRIFGIRTEGNFHNEVTGALTGENILYLHKPLEEAAHDHNVSVEDVQAAVDTLYQERERREHPDLDDKVLADWNGLMIAALARGHRVLGDPPWLDSATRAADFVLESMRTADGRLLHRWRGGDAALTALADDYAFFIWGLIELYEASGEARWLREALSLTDVFVEHFRHEEGGGFYLSPDDGERLPVRRMETYDGAIPSANSVALMNLTRLYLLTGNERYHTLALELAEALSEPVEGSPTAHSMFLAAWSLLSGPAMQVAVVGERGADDTNALLRELGSGFCPNASLVFVPAGEERPEIYSLAPYVKNYYMENDHATAYVCVDRSCQPPITDPLELASLLGSG